MQDPADLALLATLEAAADKEADLLRKFVEESDEPGIRELLDEFKAETS